MNRFLQMIWKYPVIPVRTVAGRFPDNKASRLILIISVKENLHARGFKEVSFPFQHDNFTHHLANHNLDMLLSEISDTLARIYFFFTSSSRYSSGLLLTPATSPVLSLIDLTFRDLVACFHMRSDLHPRTQRLRHVHFIGKCFLFIGNDDFLSTV